MSGKQERKLEELSVNGPAFRSVLEQARKRQAVMIGLRAMIDEAGAELRDIILRPGEIERMKRDLKEDLRTKGDPGADEQADEFEAMLVEIRRRVEQGVLRFSRKKPAKDTAGKEATPSNAEPTEQAADAGRTKSDEGGPGVSEADQGESGEAKAPRAASSGRVPEAQATVRNANADLTDDGEGRGETPTLPPEPRTAEEADEASQGREEEREEGDDEASQPDPRATDWRNPPGGNGERDDD